MIPARASKTGSLLTLAAALLLVIATAGCRTFDRGTVSDAVPAPGAEAPLLAAR